MSTQQQLDDHIIERYTAQPTRLPTELRRQIEHAWQGAPIQLYALADLDQSLLLTESWLALGPTHIAVAKRDSEGWDMHSIERSRIEAVREAPGLSANTLTILGHKLKHTAIEVVRDYDRTLPKLTIRGSELNQVWTNLLDNAIDALGESGTITITVLELPKGVNDARKTTPGHLVGTYDLTFPDGAQAMGSVDVPFCFAGDSCR